MGKTIKGKDKAARKTAAAKRKIERKTKCGKVAAILAAFALAAILTGCTTADSAQPAKSQTQTNTFKDCIVIVATQASVSNRVVRADGSKDIPAVELFTQTQSLESTGSTDTFGQTNTQTPTTDIKPDVDVHYNDAVGKGSDAAAAFLSPLTSESFAALCDYVTNKKSGSVTVTKKDGTTETLECKGGSCTYSGGTITAEDCAACSDYSPK
ncbi:MAG: hypothetical protein II840_10290 [Kiritimatiellae bacterium]|nr:hypothetical protein [Kiritimatiellia bacterium]